MVPRRTLLQVLGSSVALGLGGCTELFDGDSEGTPKKDTSSTTTPIATPTATLSPTRPADSTRATATRASTSTATSTGTETSTPPSSEVVGTPALTQDLHDDITEFGRAVALSNEVAIVVAEEAGAYVFEADDGWAATTVLRPDHRDDFGGYNVSATLVGEKALVGGPDAGKESGRGAVALFERLDDGWSQRHWFELDDGDDRDEFGKSVASDGSRVVVGDVHDPETMVPWIGDVYVYRANGSNWTREAVLGPDASNLFGTSVGVADDTILVGAPYYQRDDERTGAAYVYQLEEGEWAQQTVLVPPTLKSGSKFGQAVDIDGDTIAVGAPGEDRGSVYVFERPRDEWIQQARVTPPASDAGGPFGDSVELNSGTAIIGAPASQGNGRAYVLNSALHVEVGA